MKTFNSISLLLIFFAASVRVDSQWVQTGPEGGIVNALAVSSNGIMFAGTNNGIFLSYNSGQTWEAGSGNPFDFYASSFVFLGNFVFAGGVRRYTGYQSGGIYASSDNGDTWVSVHYGSVNALAVKGTKLFAGIGFNPLPLYAGGTQQELDFDNPYPGGVMYSTNYGGNWLSTALPDSISVNSLTVSGLDIYAGTVQGVYLTTDDGNSWSLRNSGIPSNYGVYSLTVSSPNIFAGTNNGIYLSTNGGGSWASVSSGLVMNERVYTILVSGSTIFAGIFSGGIFKSTNNGSNWQKTDNGITNDLIRPILLTAGNFYAGTLGGGVFKSTNNGGSWYPANTGLRLQSIWSMLKDGNNMFAGTQGGGVYMSTDNGNSWNVFNNGLGNQIVYTMVKNGTYLFAGTYEGIYRSSDNGNHWDTASSGLQDSVILSLAANGTHVFAGTQGSGVFRSSDNGMSWLEANSGIFPPAYIRGFGNIGDTLFALRYPLFYGSAIYRTVNFGSNWTITGYYNLPLTITSYGSNLFAGGVRGDVGLSTDMGANWTTIASNPTQWNYRDIRSISVNSSYVFVGTEGFSVWRRPLSEVIGISSISAETPIKFALYQNYPNPFNPATKIRFDVPSDVKRETANVKLIIYDVRGREVATLVNELLKPGTYEMEWDATNYPSGVYFYKLQSSDYSESKKMILLK